MNLLNKRLINELDNEMEKADTRMQTVMKKMQKVLHLSNGKFNLFYL